MEKLCFIPVKTDNGVHDALILYDTGDWLEEELGGFYIFGSIMNVKSLC